jgi:hypothetical protein
VTTHWKLATWLGTGPSTHCDPIIGPGKQSTHNLNLNMTQAIPVDWLIP